MTNWQLLKNKLTGELFPFAYDIYFSLYSENQRYSKIKILLNAFKSIVLNLLATKEQNFSLENEEVLFIDTKHFPVYSNFQYFIQRHENKTFSIISLENLEFKNKMMNLQKIHLYFKDFISLFKRSLVIQKKILKKLSFESMIEKSIIFLLIYKNLILLNKFTKIKGIKSIYFGHNSSTLVSLIYHNIKNIHSITIQHGLPVETYFPIQSNQYLVWDEYSKNKFILNKVDESTLKIESCPRFDCYIGFQKKLFSDTRITYFTQINSPEVSTKKQLKSLYDFVLKIKDIQGIKLFIRPHPSDNIKMIKAILEDVIDYDIYLGNLKEVFQNTDIAVSLYSTVLYEAKILKIQTIQIYIENENYVIFDFVDKIICNFEEITFKDILGIKHV